MFGPLLVAASTITAPPIQTGWGVIAAPAYPPVCATLEAQLVPQNRSIDALDGDPARSSPDTERIQSALDACPKGHAVKLVTGADGATGFLTAPLKLRSGVLLWVDDPVTLFASRNPRDYDDGSGLCGTAIPANLKTCRPFISARDVTGSGIIGGGVIDGRGGSLLTAGPNAGKRSWWDVAWQTKSQGLYQQNPHLIEFNDSRNIVLRDTRFENGPNFHIVTNNVDGLTAWGINILTPTLNYTRAGYACPPDAGPEARTPATCFTPNNAKNTDGFDPGTSRRVLLAYSYISTGDDNVAIKSGKGPPSERQIYVHNQFGYGHGMSIGSETTAGVRDIRVAVLAIDGHDGVEGIGLRIKSDRSRGGLVEDVRYEGVCMRNVRQPLIFSAYYMPAQGTRYPEFRNIQLRDIHNLGSSRYGAGSIDIAGYSDFGVNLPLSIALSNVVFEGQPRFAKGRNGAPETLPANARIILGPEAVSFANLLTSNPERDLMVAGRGAGGLPRDCTQAFADFHALMPESPI